MTPDEALDELHDVPPWWSLGAMVITASISVAFWLVMWCAWDMSRVPFWSLIGGWLAMQFSDLFYQLARDCWRLWRGRARTAA